MKTVSCVVVAVVAILAVARNGFGQPADLAKILIGTWEGEVERIGAQRFQRDAHLNLGSTLVIESLEVNEGRGQGKGRLTVAGGPMVPADIQARTDGDKVVVTVRNPRGVTAELSLSSESTLAGTIGGGGFGAPHPTRFTKKR